MNIVKPEATGEPTAKRTAKTNFSTIQTTSSGMTVSTPASKFARMLRLVSLCSLNVETMRRLVRATPSQTSSAVVASRFRR
jgi:hypothetical protein